MGDVAATGFYGLHWTNLLSIVPDDYPHIVDKWIDYFLRCSQTFGVILAKDVAQGSSQALYKRFARTRYENGAFFIDLKPARAKGAVGLSDKLCVSVKKGAVPKDCAGGTIRKHSEKNGFVNYEITAEAETLAVMLMPCI